MVTRNELPTDFPRPMGVIEATLGLLDPIARETEKIQARNKRIAAMVAEGLEHVHFDSYRSERRGTVQMLRTRLRGELHYEEACMALDDIIVVLNGETFFGDGITGNLVDHEVKFLPIDISGELWIQITFDVWCSK